MVFLKLSGVRHLACFYWFQYARCMHTIDNRFEQAISSKTDEISKLKEELDDLRRLKASISKYSITWPYPVSSKNANRVAIQVHVLFILFARAEKIKTLSRPRSKGLTTHQIWKHLYPTSTSTSSATFRNHLRDLVDKKLIEKVSGTEDWRPTELAIEKIRWDVTVNVPPEKVEKIPPNQYCINLDRESVENMAEDEKLEKPYKWD